MSSYHDVVATNPPHAFTPRLQLLEDSDQVSPLARRLTLDFVAAVERVFALPLDEDNGAMLVTHLAIAMTRTERGAAMIDDPPAALVAEVRHRDAERAFVREQLDGYADPLGSKLPDAEYVFVTAHVCTLTAVD